MLTAGNKSGTKDAIVERMTSLKYSVQDVKEAEAAFKMWKIHLYNRYDDDDPIFNDKQRSCDEQKCFDAFIFSQFKCYFDRQMNHRTRQSMYDLKKHLRRNWRLLGFEPHFSFFDKGEEAYCYNKNEEFLKKYIQPNRKNSEKRIPSEVPDSDDNQNKWRANNKRPLSQVDSSYNNGGNSGQRRNDRHKGGNTRNGRT